MYKRQLLAYPIGNSSMANSVVLDPFGGSGSVSYTHLDVYKRQLLKVRPKVSRIVGLTGTPASNGLMDLWAEFRILDMGQRLGRFITKYRTDYFTPDKRNGQVIYSYKPLPLSLIHI